MRSINYSVKFLERAKLRRNTGALLAQFGANGCASKGAPVPRGVGV